MGCIIVARQKQRGRDARAERGSRGETWALGGPARHGGRHGVHAAAALPELPAAPVAAGPALFHLPCSLPPSFNSPSPSPPSPFFPSFNSLSLSLSLSLQPNHVHGHRPNHSPTTAVTAPSITPSYRLLSTGIAANGPIFWLLFWQIDFLSAPSHDALS
jgi:hypothetical protein